VPRSRKARPEDVGAIALALPEVTESVSWGDRPGYQVRDRTFVIHRGPRKDAVDENGEMLPDVIMIRVATPGDKEALLAAGPPWFTTPHFNGYNAVLVRESQLGQVSRDELAEVIEDAWLARAPKRLAAQWLADRG
jgi:hypothetical protein